MADENQGSPVEQVISSAVGIAIGSNISGDSGTAALVQAAMTEAVKKAHENNITDPEAIKALMMDARAKVLLGS
jgi:hypothetical protein